MYRIISIGTLTRNLSFDIRLGRVRTPRMKAVVKNWMVFAFLVNFSGSFGWNSAIRGPWNAPKKKLFTIDFRLVDGLERGSGAELRGFGGLLCGFGVF